MKIFALILMIINLGLNPETARIYPMTAQIVEFDYQSDLVSAVNGNGECFQFYGIEDWQLGDIVSLMMVDPGTPEILDDDAILHWYSGFTMEIPEIPLLTCGE